MPGTVINLRPVADEALWLEKGTQRYAISDRLPASLLPYIAAAMEDDGSINFESLQTINRLCQIFAQMIVNANEGVTLDQALDFLDVQDVPVLFLRLINPQAPSSGTAATPTEEVTSKAPTRRRRK